MDVKKLEDIPKKNIFEVPEGYFDKLPGVIQSRVAAPKSNLESHYFTLVVRYALPVVFLSAAAVFVYRNYVAREDADNLLAAVSTEALTEYLDESEITTDEFLEEVGYENIDADGLAADPILQLDLDADVLDSLTEEYQNEL